MRQHKTKHAATPCAPPLHSSAHARAREADRIDARSPVDEGRPGGGGVRAKGREQPLEVASDRKELGALRGKL